MGIVESIVRKRDGGILTPAEITALVQGYTKGEIPDYQAAALLMAIYFQGLSAEELSVLAEAMMNSGRKLSWEGMNDPLIDKHSTGGVGDKVSLILAPLAAAAGVKVPMIAGRGLGHTGGTIDKLESIPGFRTDLSLSDFQSQVKAIGCAIIAQSVEIAPADRKLYALRDVTGAVESLPLIAASIMSKKLAAGLSGLVLDVKVGSGAFMKTKQDAERLARAMIAIGKGLKTPVTAILTDMSQPLGRAVGNRLEVRECVEVLQGSEAYPDLLEITLVLTAAMVAMSCPQEKKSSLKSQLKRLLKKGKAWEFFCRMVAAQGGEASFISDANALSPQGHTLSVVSSAAGYIHSLDTYLVGEAARGLKAGRKKLEDSIDPNAGILVEKKIGAKVEPGDVLCRLYAEDASLLPEAAEKIRSAYEIGSVPPAPQKLIIKTIGAS